MLIPAPIKRSYIWDLAPHVSVVRRCLQQNMRVYLAEWMPLAGSEQNFGLDEYADRLLSACLDAIASETGQERVILVAHSLGGTLAAIFSCLHPQRVRSLVLLSAPLQFAAAAGDFAPLISAAPDATMIARMFGQVPGSFLNLTSGIATGGEFQWQCGIDLLACAADYRALATHLRVQRWMLDEFTLPEKLFAEVVELLYREDRLMQGRLRVHGKLVGPHDLTVPLLSAFDPRSSLIPPQSIIPFHQAAASSQKKLLAYQGDVGVAIQHVGMLVGSNAHTGLWPAIFNWLAAIGMPP
ncbi:MAG TPA: alpha/beta hydrolase [Oxalobacteraceae bacterium]|nr:alpha/beta hydrolase [Oxalobacteraceae bacterium]